MKKIILIIVYTLSLTVGNMVYAQTGEYTTLAPLPGTTKSCNGTTCTADINSYLGGFLNLTITIGAVLAMIYIGLYGFQYAVSDSAPKKSEYKDKLWTIFQGLLLILSAYVIIYTINPKLVAVNLNLESPKYQPVPVDTTGGNASMGTVGCRSATECVYRYTNSVGASIAYKNCFECNAATTYGIDVKTTVIDGKNALINRDLGSRLAAIQAESNKLGTQPQFILTETWPPTVNHAEQGQYNGTSVDLAFKTPPTATQIKTFIEIASRNGISAQYEVKTQAEADSLIAQGVPTSGILAVGYVTGGHFSIYKK